MSSKKTASGDKSLKDAVIIPRFMTKPPFSLEAPGYKPVKGETIPRRNPATVNGLIEKPEEGVETIFDIIRSSSEKYGNAKALGSRKLVKTHQEVKKVKKIIDGQEQEVDKKWTYFELSEYSYMSFTEYEQLILQVGAGLRKMVSTPSSGFSIRPFTVAGLRRGIVSPLTGL